MAAPEPGIYTTRRFYLLKRIAASEAGERAIASVWKTKQEAEPGTALSNSFPSRSALADVGYTTLEDLRGASIDELVSIGLSTPEAEAVLAAL